MKKLFNMDAKKRNIIVASILGVTIGGLSMFGLNHKNKELVQKENKKLKEKINKNNNLDEKQILNQELKIRLNNTIRDISRVAGLMANNTIIDEDTLSLVKKLKNELRFLNEQTELYSSQQKF